VQIFSADVCRARLIHPGAAIIGGTGGTRPPQKILVGGTQMQASPQQLPLLAMSSPPLSRRNRRHCHGLHEWVRLCGTPDSLLPTHGLLPTTGQRGGRYDPQPVTRSSEWV